MIRSSFSDFRFRCLGLLLGAALLGIANPCHGLAADAAAPNFIFILADDQGWNGTSVQMHPDLPDSKSDFYRTPHLERMASEGMRFSQAYAPGPMCSPTRASLQTGKSPAQLGMTNVGNTRSARPSDRLVLPPHTSHLSREEVTIGEVLQEAGYSTAWFGKFHLGSEGPAVHGYDQSDGPTGNGNGATEDPQNPKDIFGITERGISFMEQNVKAGKPFYLQLWHYAVHGPVQTKPETQQRYAARSAGVTHQSVAFAGMTEDLDTGVGMILAKVDELSIADNTYVIYMSDHGAGRALSSNAPLNRGKGTLSEGGIRVPLIVRGPGVKAGVFCNVPTVGWDLFPTFCDLAGVKTELPAGVEGVSLRPLFADGTGNVGRPGNRIAHHFPHYGQGPPQSTITADGFKLIRLYDSDQWQLFDLNQDIGEAKDLSTEQPERTAALKTQLVDYLASVGAGLPTLNPEFDPDAAAQPGERTQRRRRGGARRGQLEQRQKELAALEAAIDKNDLDEVGQLVATMVKAFENAPARPGRARTTDNQGVSPRERRQQQLQQLSDAQKEGDVKKLRSLVTEIRQQLQNSPPGRGRPQGQPGAGRQRSE